MGLLKKIGKGLKKLVKPVGKIAAVGLALHPVTAPIAAPIVLGRVAAKKAKEQEKQQRQADAAAADAAAANRTAMMTPAGFNGDTAAPVMGPQETDWLKLAAVGVGLLAILK